MKLVSLFVLVLACLWASAQGIDDVLRYSTENLQGTARFQGMSGAFGALGGDLSALHANPAGSAVFNYGQFTITASNYNTKNEALLGNTLQTTTNNAVEINQIGGVLVFNPISSSWKKIALAFNYDRVQNFDNEIVASGNSSQSIDTYFLAFAQGQRLGPLQLRIGESVEDAYLDIGASSGFAAQQAFLGLQAGIIAPAANNPNNTAYVSAIHADTVYQEFLESTSGANSKFTLNVAGQYQDNLYLGASLNFHTVFYERFTSVRETGSSQDNVDYRITFDNFLRTQGGGFSLGLGGIAKLTDNLRIGASYHSPTWYTLQDEFSQRISSSLADQGGNLVDFGIVTLFEEYRIKTPAKVSGSAALVFGKTALLSADYSYQDMSRAELRPTTDPDFAEENAEIANELGGVNTVRLGGELRLAAVSIRAGYRFEESPYKDETTLGNLNSFSTGIGYNFGASNLDLGFSRSEQDVTTFFFDSGIDNAALVNRSINTVTLSYSLKL